MKDDKKLELLLERFYNRFNQYNTKVLQKMGDAIKKFDGVSPSVAHKIAQELKYGANIDDLMADLSELSENEIQVEFDYSRFENQEKTQLRLEREVSQGITSKVEYRMKVYGETEEVAKQKIDEIKKNEPNVKDLLGTNNEE